MAADQREQMTRLGLYGVIPFIAAAVALWISPVLLPQYVALDFHQLALIYGGVVVVYLSGIEAGALLTIQTKHTRSFLPGMMVTLAAFLVMLPSGTFFFAFGAAWRHAFILVLLIYLLLRDLRSVKAGLAPVWYGNLRTRVTLWMSLSIMLIIMRLFVWGFY